MQRHWIDSEGNRGRVILFSEIPDHVVLRLQKMPPLSGRRANVKLNKENFKYLTSEQIDTIIMRFWRGMSLKRIAGELHISRQAVERRLKRAYKRLHKLHIGET